MENTEKILKQLLIEKKFQTEFWLEMRWFFVALISLLLAFAGLMFDSGELVNVMVLLLSFIGVVFGTTSVIAINRANADRKIDLEKLEE